MNLNSLLFREMLSFYRARGAHDHEDRAQQLGSAYHYGGLIAQYTGLPRPAGLAASAGL